MCAAHVTVTIRNPADRAREWRGSLRYDTAAKVSLVPRPLLDAIGLTAKGARAYELPDGTLVEMDITTAELEVMDEIVGGTIIMGDADAEPLLGVTALESVGIEVDPNNQRLKRLPSVRLKKLRVKRRT